MAGLDERFAKMVAKWFDECEELLTDESLEENTRDLVESYMVFFSFNSLLHAVLNESATVIEVTKNSKGQVLGVKIGGESEAPTEST